MVDEPKYLPLETGEGQTMVRRPTLWTRETLKGFLFGCLKAAGINLGAAILFGPLSMAAGVLSLVALGVMAYDTFQGATKGYKRMDKLYKMAENQQRQQVGAAKSPEKSPSKTKEKSASKAPPDPDIIQDAALDSSFEFETKTNHTQRLLEEKNLNNARSMGR